MKKIGIMLFALTGISFVFAMGKTEVAAGNYRDTITVAITAQPPTLDPATTTSIVAVDVANNFYETLYTFNAQLEPSPMLAESYTSNADKTEYTFKLRKGVLFHDGTELTADDVTASMNYWLKKSAKASALLVGGNWKKIDDYTVKVTFTEPAPDLINLMSSKPYFPAVRPRKSIEEAGEKGVTALIGTGPYKVKEVKQDQYILLEKKSNLFRIKNSTQRFHRR